ncbi:MAG: hypothetical protein QW734_11275 [Candidatus Bathyarchaeia archaeon]
MCVLIGVGGVVPIVVTRVVLTGARLKLNVYRCPSAALSLDI